MKLRLSNREVQTLLDFPPEEFPKYATQIINLANQNAGGTRPRIVGQQSDLIQEFPGKTIAEWQSWYVAQYPDAIENATDKIYTMVENLRGATEKIDRAMVEKWVRDLILVKTFTGLRFQETILQKVAHEKSVNYSISSSEEEARGIDGYIGDLPVSIKPDTYRAMSQLPETIEVGIIYYRKVKDGLTIEYDF